MELASMKIHRTYRLALRDMLTPLWMSPVLLKIQLPRLQLVNLPPRYYPHHNRIPSCSRGRRTQVNANLVGRQQIISAYRECSHKPGDLHEGFGCMLEDL